MNHLVLIPLLACFAIVVAETAQARGFASRSSSLDRIQDVLLGDWLDRHGHSPSNITVNEAFAIPNSQGWCQCSDCGLRADGEIAVLSPVNQKVFTHPTLVSWSLWGEFFHENQNDRYYAKSTSMDDFNRKYYVERPVFVLPMITLHVGHVLIDVLEQLYHTHMRLYGTIRRDCLIILDVASGEERAVLNEKIRLTVNSDAGKAGMLLRQFTDLPVFGLDLWNELRSLDGVVFKDLHIGLDISKSFFNAGQKSQPCIASLTHGNAEVLASAQRYREFSHFVRNTDRLFAQSDDMSPSHTVHPRVFVDQRSTNRVILNIKDLQDTLEDANLTSAVQSLDDISFRNQLEMFQNIDILVSVAGTALHNVLFMRPGSAVILFMQPEWCEQAWMYANQAVLLGIAPFVHCAPSTPPVAPAQTPQSVASTTAGAEESSSEVVSVHDPAVFKHFQWSRQFWLQGPRHHKAQNITVDPAVFALLLQNASAYVEAHRESATKNFDLVKILQEERNLDSLMCPGYTPSLYKAPPSVSTETFSAPSKPSPQTPAPVIQRIVEMYVSSIDVNFEGNSWKLAVTGEIGAARGSLDVILRSMPHLTFCMESTDVPAWCYPVAGFNYYTNLNLDMALPLQSLHFWAQVSTTGGKIRHSDVFVSLDCRLPQAGLDLHHRVIGLDVHFEVDVLQECTDPTTNQRHDQVLRYRTHKIDAPRLTCASSERAVFQHKMVSRLSLQRFTADFCFAHELNGLNCADFVYVLQLYLRRVLNGAQLGLPAVQGTPRKNNPFFFMHLEKTAGTTIREYIYESLPAPNSTALIPCYTTHCTVSVIPKHKPQVQGASAQELSVIQTVESTVSVDGAVEWSQLSDLRLIQPSARDISNLTVIAGHFNFYAVHQALPQCQTTVPGKSSEPDESLWSSHILTRIDPHNPVVPPAPVSTPQCHVSCFVMGRHPVSRAISYYYQRVYKHFDKSDLPLSESAEAAPFGGRPLEQRMMNELTPAQLELIALSTREGIESHLFPGRHVFIDEGMTDAACHAFLSLKYTTGLPVGPLTVPPAIPPELYPQAIQNLRQCVVGMQEQWNDTLRVLDHWYPWIDFSVDPARRKMSIFKGLETLTTLRPDLYDVLAALNPCDMILYDEMIRLFRAQLSVLEA